MRYLLIKVSNDKFVNDSLFCSNWKLVKLVPYCKFVDIKKTDKNIKILLEDWLNELNLSSPSIEKYSVNDNASNVIKAVKLSSQLKLERCSTHTINLAVYDALLGNKSVKNTAGKKISIKGVIRKSKVITRKTKKSPAMTKKLKFAARETGIKFVTLKQSNKTRWNSTHTNMDSVKKMKVPLNFLKGSDREWSDLVFDSEEWDLVDAMTEILEIPKRVSKALEVDQDPNKHLVVKEMYNLQEELKEFENDKNKPRITRNFAKLLGEFFEAGNRFPNCGTNVQLHRFAHYLDPNMKGCL